MYKFYKLFILFSLSLFIINCGEDKLPPPPDDGGTEDTQTIASYSRNYELVANYNNDECFTKLFDPVSFIACSVISVPTATTEEVPKVEEPLLKNIETTTLYLSGREVIGEVLNLNHKEKTDSKLVNDAVTKYNEDALGFINDLTSFTIIDTEGIKTLLDDFIYDQYVEFTNYDSKFRDTHTVKTGSVITRTYEIIPNYNNDACFTTTFTNQDFLSCSLIAINSIKVPATEEGEPDTFSSGREMLARSIEASLDSEALTDKELYEDAKEAFENHGLFLQSFKDLGYEVLTAAKIFDLYQVLVDQAEEYRLFNEDNS